jgi:hypothetical protein
MPKLLTNPQDFKRKCNDVGVTYDLLIEAQECLGKRKFVYHFNIQTL